MCFILNTFAEMKINRMKNKIFHADRHYYNVCVYINVNVRLGWDRGQ